MPLVALTCPNCGGPLPSNARRAVVVCGYCGASVSLAQKLVRAARFREALRAQGAAARDQHCLALGGHAYRVLGRVAQGDTSDVFIAERAQRVSERVLIKLVRDASDGDLLQREVELVTRLGGLEVRGARHFRRLIPEPTFAGMTELGGRAHPVAVYRYRAGFTHTLTDILRAHPEGLDPSHAVWIWRRVLEVLSWLHSEGVVHGAPLPEHIIVHAAEHAVMLVGFSCGVTGGGRVPLVGVGPASRRFYPDDVLRGRPLDPGVDLVVAARAVRCLLGAGADVLPDTVPRSLARLVATYAEQPVDRWPTTDAFELRQLAGQAARKAFGPPQFIPLPLPAVAAH